MTELKISVRINNVLNDKNFTLQQIINLINLFFNQIMSTEDLLHIISLINYYIIHEKDALN